MVQASIAEDKREAASISKGVEIQRGRDPEGKRSRGTEIQRDKT